MKRILSHFILISFIFSQFQYSGQLGLCYSSFLDNHKTISKPFRIGVLDMYYTFANIDLISKNAIEYNWITQNSTYDFRELYISWYPYFGEIRLGKQIIPLGMADGNNPTDNINPYNYNYLFLSGIDRKVGVNSLYSDIYINDYQLNIILKIDNSKSIFPSINDDSIFPDFNLNTTDNNLEYGISLKMMLKENDISFSYFNTIDHIPTNNENNLSYRRTHILGANTVGFIKEFTYRLEIAYFITKYNNQTHGSYIQYTNQLEYETYNNTMLIIQYVGENVLYNKFDDFRSGIGNPILSIFNNSLLFSAKKNFMDDRFNCNLSSIINLNNELHSINVILEYELINNWELGFRISKFVTINTDNSFYNNIENNSQSTISINFYY